MAYLSDLPPCALCSSDLSLSPFPASVGPLVHPASLLRKLLSYPGVESGMVGHTCIPSIVEVEAGGLHSEFKVSLGYVRPCLKIFFFLEKTPT